MSSLYLYLYSIFLIVYISYIYRDSNSIFPTLSTSTYFIIFPLYLCTISLFPIIFPPSPLPGPYLDGRL